MASEGSDAFDRQLQPHLTAPHTGIENPAMTLNENDVTVSVQHTAGPAASSPPSTWERFDDDDDAERRQGGSTTTHSSNGVGPPAPSAGSQGKGVDPPSTSLPPAQHPVLYNCQSGEAVVVPGDVTTVAPGNGTGCGGAVIATRHIPERWRDMERPLRARQMKILKVLSVLAAVMFFPTGIPAAYYAWRTQAEFDAGILRGNIDRAQKFARRTERLVILSAILLVLVAVLVFALVERARNGYTVDHSYVAHTSVQGRA